MTKSHRYLEATQNSIFYATKIYFLRQLINLNKLFQIMYNFNFNFLLPIFYMCDEINVEQKLDLMSLYLIYIEARVSVSSVILSIYVHCWWLHKRGNILNIIYYNII